MKPQEVTVLDIARLTGVLVDEIWKYASTIDQEYWPTRLKWVKGKRRPIDAPKRLLKYRLRRLHTFLQQTFPPNRNVHGGARGRSCFTAASLHRGRKYVVTRDVEDCY